MELQEKIARGQKKILEKKLLPRTVSSVDFLNLGKIVCFLGGRRTGKTSLMFYIVQQYIKKKKITSQQLIHIDFSELDNVGIDLTAVHKLYHHIQPIYILDEIQELPGFEKQLTRLYNQGVIIFISGSNSHLLGQEISTKLRGRVYEVYNDVLSFEEFLVFKGVAGLQPGGEMDILFEEYLMWGGYPEVVLQQTIEAKKSLLQSYFDVTIYRDLIDRYSIRNETILFHLMKSLIAANTKHVNVNKLFNTYKSLGYKISKNTLAEYIQYLKNVFFVTSVKHAFRKTYFDKVYLLDNGYMNLFDDSKNLGQKFENTIYKHIRRTNHHLGYNDEPYDVDFTDGVQQRQVCYKITEENVTRETACAKNMLPITMIVGNKSPLVSPAILQKKYSDLLLPSLDAHA